jgi:prophage regulatory protein
MRRGPNEEGTRVMKTALQLERSREDSLVAVILAALEGRKHSTADQVEVRKRTTEPQCGPEKPPMTTQATGDRAGTVAGLPRYLAWDEVIELTGMSRSTLKRAIKDGEFPEPRKLTRGRVGFRFDELAAWVETRPPATGWVARRPRGSKRLARLG